MTSARAFRGLDDILHQSDNGDATPGVSVSKASSLEIAPAPATPVSTAPGQASNLLDRPEAKSATEDHALRAEAMPNFRVIFGELPPKRRPIQGGA